MKKQLLFTLITLALVHTSTHSSAVRVLSILPRLTHVVPGSKTSELMNGLRRLLTPLPIGMERTFTLPESLKMPANLTFFTKEKLAFGVSCVALSGLMIYLAKTYLLENQPEDASGKPSE